VKDYNSRKKDKIKMFWPGDSLFYSIRKRWLSLFYQGGIKTIWREEILCGLDFGIPLCCVFWYTFTVYFCLCLPGKDSFLMTLLLGKNAWADFAKIHYYRCPLCRGLNHSVKVKFEKWH